MEKNLPTTSDKDFKLAIKKNFNEQVEEVRDGVKGFFNKLKISKEINTLHSDQALEIFNKQKEEFLINFNKTIETLSQENQAQTDLYKQNAMNEISKKVIIANDTFMKDINKIITEIKKSLFDDITTIYMNYKNQQDAFQELLDKNVINKKDFDREVLKLEENKNDELKAIQSRCDILIKKCNKYFNDIVV